MVEGDLSADLIQDGEDFISAADGTGFRPEAALWFRQRDVDIWRLRIVTPLLDEVGFTEAYIRLLDLFDRLDGLSHLSIEDVRLDGRGDELLDELLASSPMLEAGRQALAKSYWHGDYDLLLYRNRPVSTLDPVAGHNARRRRSA